MQKTNTNISPIFDDYDETKNFHRVLFNAGKTVQARELTQAQSILQNQIERLGKHLFTEGAMVVPGGIKAIPSQDYAKIALTNGSLYTDFANSTTELYVSSNGNGSVYKIAKTFDADSTDPVTLFLDLLTPGSNQEKALIPNEPITIYTISSSNVQQSLATATVSEIGQGAWIKVQSGVYFVRGMLVRTDSQEYVVSKYTTSKTLKVGFSVNEQIVTAADDVSLYSNANGFPNQNAAGASRLKIALTLTGLDVNAVDSNFIEIARFDGGSLSNKVDYTSYSLIEQAIAQRTYETNGDYVVNNFGLDVKEHLKNGNNGGVYLAADGGDETKVVAAVKPGIGYVKGYRVENIGIQNVVLDKARDTAFLNNAAYTADYGQYFMLTNVKSLPDIDIKKQILLLDGGNTQIGTARVRAMRKDGSYYRLYVFDVNMNLGKYVSDVVSVKYTDASSLFTATVYGSLLYSTNTSSLLFKLPVPAVKSLFQAGVGGDTSYTVYRTYNLTTNSSGVVSASANANEFFGAVDANNYMVGLSGAASLGTLFDPTVVVSLGGTIQGTTMTINLGNSYASTAIKVIAPVLKNQTTQKTKTLLTVTNEVISFPTTNTQALANADIYDIISVVDNTTGVDLTSLFTFDNGQRDNWYEVGKLKTIDPTPIIRTVKVTYRYFAHSAGDYFSVDSYSGLTRGQIYSYNGVNLADAIDFRPLKDSSGNFTSSTVFGEIIKPGDTIRADITYYLPRTDIVVVNSNGVFSDVRGIPSLNPVAPATPQDSLKLYELYLPAYTPDVTAIGVKAIDNRRYTMRDIGKLENRIANVEYYTTLSALESKTNKTEVLDPTTGNNRFKNGFAVDGFTDFRLADTSSSEWAASLDLNKGQLNPQFAENGVDLTASSYSGVVKRNRVFMGGYTELVAVSQPYATTTININPYAVFSWIGTVKLTPDRDFWKDVYYIQPIIINNTVNYTGGEPQGTFWGTWEKTTYDMLGGHDAWASKQYVSYQYQYVTTINSQTFSSSVDNLVATSLIPFMRSIPISFKCIGFRPFTRLYPFFDSVSISVDCKPDGGNYGDALITDASGYLSGTFLVPCRADRNFKVGTSVFKFTDDPKNSDDPNVVTTSGSTTFSSGGISEARQVTVTNTTVLTSTTTAVKTGAVQYIDPIAQTFIMPSTGGSYATKVDIFFATKDRNVPVTLQLRKALSGLPSSDIITTVTLNPSQVNVSNDGSVATSFVFDDPVYLQQGEEYAIVLTADTQSYNVYLARQGQNIIGSNMALSKQAYTGVFLTSSNSSTWNPDQTADLKFNIYRAVFATGSSSVTFDSSAPIALPLPFNAVTTTSGSNNLVVKMPSHGLKAGDTVTLYGLVTGNNVNASDLNGVTKTVLTSDIDTFTIQAATTANATGTIGGSAMTAVANYPFNIFVGNVASFVPDGTSVTWEYQYTSQNTRVKSGWVKFNPMDSNTLPVEAVCIAAGDFQVRATLNITADNLSPSIESSGFNAVLVSLRVDPSRKVFTYVTQDIKFNNPSTTARFFVGATLPGSSGMKLYVKLLQSADQDVSSTPWAEVTATTPVTNSESAIEYEYDISGSTFVGYKIKVELTGSNANPPSLSDIRTLAFA